jgi:hypothetical protein
MRLVTQLKFGWVGVYLLCAAAHAQDSTTYETDANGVTWMVSNRVVQKSIPSTEYQTREQKVYKPQLTTQYQAYQQTYVTPVTEYQWVTRQRGLWNPFMQPYWSNELVPVTRWEARPSTVQIPISRTDWVEETRTTQVPVTTYRTVQDQQTSRVAVSAAPSGAAGATAIASRPAAITGQQMQSDPPRSGNPYSNVPTSDYRR